MSVRNSGTSSQVVAVFFLVILVLGLVSVAVALVSWNPNPPGVTGEDSESSARLQSLVNGTWTGFVETEIETGLPLRSAAVRAAATLRYLIFRSGNDGVVIGRDGWLYTREEFEHHRSDPEVLAERLEFVRSVHDVLEALGVELVVVLIPSKARVVPGPLPSRWAGLAKHPRYQEAIEVLRGSVVRVVDLRPAFKSMSDPFLRTDTHWTPAGSRAAAAAVARELQDSATAYAARAEYQTRPLDPVEAVGDLTSFVPLGGLSSRLGLAPEMVTPYQTVETSAPALGLFDLPTIPVTLIGTSYSADPRWNFAGELRQALSLDVLDVSTEAVGPFDPMGDYLGGTALAEVQPVVVVWEIPERYLTLPGISVPSLSGNGNPLE